MSTPFLGEIRAFGFTFAPTGWAFCDGQLLSIAQYSALFAIIGTYFGGNGQTTFQLPNLQGRIPMHWGNGAGLSSYVLGETEGTPSVTVTLGQMPMHTHTVHTAVPQTATQGTGIPTNSAYLGSSDPDKLYNDATPNPATSFSQKAIWIAGQGLPHENMQPFLAVNFCIALAGIFPSRN